MNPRPNPNRPPFGPGKYVVGPILEAISEEEKNGRPVAPLFDVKPGIPPEVIESEAKAARALGRGVAAFLNACDPQFRFALMRVFEEELIANLETDDVKPITVVDGGR